MSPSAGSSWRTAAAPTSVEERVDSDALDLVGERVVRGAASVAFAVVLDARRGADQHQPIDEVRRCEGEVQAQPSAHRVADVRRPPALDAEHRRAGGKVGSNVGPVAVAGRVERDDLDVGTERGRESRHGRPPAPGGLREAVDEDDPISASRRRRAPCAPPALFARRLGGEPAERLHEHVGILRARDRPAAVDDVRRHGRDAGVVGLLAASPSPPRVPASPSRNCTISSRSNPTSAAQSASTSGSPMSSPSMK